MFIWLLIVYTFSFKIQTLVKISYAYEKNILKSANKFGFIGWQKNICDNDFERKL